MTSPESPRCSECGHSSDHHAYSDHHAAPNWMNDDGSINYATHCHVIDCTCPDWNGQGRPRAEASYPNDQHVTAGD